MLILTALALSAPYWGQSDPIKDTRALIEKLGSTTIEEREEAAQKLVELGKPVLPLLENALSHKDSEIAGRARKVIERIRDRFAKDELVRLEEAIAKASSLQIAFRSTMELRIDEGDPAKFRGSGRVWLKGKKIRADVQCGLGRMEKKVDLRSIGEDLRIKGDEGDWEVRPFPTKGEEHFALALTRIGPLLLLAWGEGKFEDAHSIGSVSECRRLPADEIGERLAYTVEAERVNDKPFEVVLWYDPKTLSLRKRTWKTKLSAPNIASCVVSATEIYDEFTVNADIPDEKFKLPER